MLFLSLFLACGSTGFEHINPEIVTWKNNSHLDICCLFFLQILNVIVTLFIFIPTILYVPSSVQILGFDWKNCGQPNDPAVMKTLAVSPDPISIPGELTATASGSTAVELTAPLSVSVCILPLSGSRNSSWCRHSYLFQPPQTTVL